VEEAMRDIALGEFRHWLDPERLAVNVASLYREYAGDAAPPDIVRMFGLMAKLKHRA
jgi:hypothetical protein